MDIIDVRIGNCVLQGASKKETKEFCDTVDYLNYSIGEYKSVSWNIIKKLQI